MYLNTILLRNDTFQVGLVNYMIWNDIYRKKPFRKVLIR